MSNQVVTITDAASGTQARVLASLGFNCFEFNVATNIGSVPVLWAEEGFADGGMRPSGSGIPLLFPFPGRIAGTSFHWQGREYPLTPGDGRGNAIHGFVHERPWRIVEQTSSRVVGQFQASVDDPALLNGWPADFRVTTDYRVTCNALLADYHVENCRVDPLPCGFGTHPYFSVPLGGESAEQCRVSLPVTTSWELADMNATGRKLPLPDQGQLRSGLLFGAMQYDNVLGDLLFEDDVCEAIVTDPQSGLRLTMSFDPTFRELVVYTPPHRQAICIEPYTCVPDCFRLAGEGVEAGLRVLEPGQSFAAHVEIRLQ